MKKIKVNRKLQFKKETIANLNEIKGGGGDNPDVTLSIWSCHTNMRSCNSAQCCVGAETFKVNDTNCTTNSMAQPCCM